MSKSKLSVRTSKSSAARRAGADLEIEPSRRGYIDERVNQLRDPAIHEEGDNVYLLYSVAGESGIAISQPEF